MLFHKSKQQEKHRRKKFQAAISSKTKSKAYKGKESISFFQKRVKRKKIKKGDGKRRRRMVKKKKRGGKNIIV